MKKILLLIMVICLCSCGQKNSVIVQDFVGHNVQEVYDWCATLDDEHSCEVAYSENDEYEKDIVYDQSVKAGGKVKDSVIFYVSNGITNEVVMPYITPDVSKSDIEIWKITVGLQNLTYQYETNETIEKNHVIRIEPSSHVKKDTPVVVYLSSGPSEPSSTTFEIELNEYLGLTVEQFENKARELGLVPNHQETRDRYNPDVKIGNIAWHGSGTYEKGENFNYGICINAITIESGTYVGYNETDFIKAAKKLNLKPVHITGRDAYSATIRMGYIVTHGSGVYVEGEDFKYGLSLGAAHVQKGYEGKKEDTFINYLDTLTLKGDRRTTYSDTIGAGRIVSYNYGNYSTGDPVTYYVSLGPEETYVDVPDFTGRSEDDLLNFFRNNGILVGSRSEDSSLLPKGTVTWNEHGRIKVGDSASYTVSSGPAVRETAIIEAFSTVADEVSFEGDYEHARFAMHRYLFGRGFMDYDIIPVIYGDYEPGILLSITIDGEPLQDYAVNVPLDAHIECRISSNLLQ